MYVRQKPKDWRTWLTLLLNWKEFEQGIQEALEKFNIPASDIPVEPPELVLIPFRPSAVPHVVFTFTTSAVDQNNEIFSTETQEQVSQALTKFVDGLCEKHGIKSAEYWFEFTLRNWVFYSLPDSEIV